MVGQALLREAAFAASLTLAVSLPVPGADCNSDGVEDFVQIRAGDVADCNGNGLPDECEIQPVNFGLSPAETRSGKRRSWSERSLRCWRTVSAKISGGNDVSWLPAR